MRKLPKFSIFSENSSLLIYPFHLGMGIRWCLQHNNKIVMVKLGTKRIKLILLNIIEGDSFDL